MRRILLVEPAYKNKYPPLGLMKLSTYHKRLGDKVTFVKGKNPSLKKQKWDRVYISTLFTFNWKQTIETISYYCDCATLRSEVYIGGVMATLLSDEIEQENEISGITIIKGLLDKPGQLDNNNILIDELSPDYTIIQPEINEYLDYTYPTNDSYIAYATRGCIRKCSFCAVSIIEPEFKHYSSLSKQVSNIRDELGRELKHLLLMDNNILASDNFEEIVNEIISLGYGRENNYFTYMKDGRKITSRKYVDFNQGTDARLLTDKNLDLISKIAIKPLRIAFDHANDTYVELYKEKVRKAASKGIPNLSNYVLFNFEDSPAELYKRLRINIELNEEFKERGINTKIFSFPMRYSPITGEFARGRKYVGENWEWKYIRAVQCILQATHGVVSPNPEFFYKAFGKNLAEFEKLLVMPNNYIIYRLANEENGNTHKWWSDYQKLDENDKELVLSVITRPGRVSYNEGDFSVKVREVLSHYRS